MIAAEQRLGVRLPPSYREFLLVSDGAYGDTIGALAAGGYRTGNPDVGLLPVSALGHFVEVDPDTVTIWLEAQDEIEHALGGPDRTPLYERGEVRDHRPVREALLIARGFDANCSLLVPVGNPGPEEEWEVWDHYEEGNIRWSSFRAYLRDTVEEHLGIDVDEAETLQLLAGAEGGDPRPALRLARVRSSEATPLLIDAARRGVALHAVLPALRRIGGRDVVALLTELRPVSWQRGFVWQALARIGTPQALDHLAAVGEFWHLAKVGDPRAAPIAGARLRQDGPAAVWSAARLLVQLPDPAWVPDLVAAYNRLTDDEARITILYALDACGAPAEALQRAPDLLGGPYGYSARALLQRLAPGTEGNEAATP